LRCGKEANSTSFEHPVVADATSSPTGAAREVAPAKALFQPSARTVVDLRKSLECFPLPGNQCRELLLRGLPSLATERSLSEEMRLFRGTWLAHLDGLHDPNVAANHP
jgi:hypothetical protein